MLEMIIFWLAYGLWTAFLFSGVVWLGTIAVTYLVIWITDEDYDFRESEVYDTIVECHFETPLNTIKAIIYGFGLVTLIGITAHVLASEKDTYHTIAVNIAEFVTTYLSQPLLIMLSVVGLALLAKKVYPLFKKIKTLLDNDNQ